MSRKKANSKITLHAHPDKVRRIWKLNPKTRVQTNRRKDTIEKERLRENDRGEI